MQRAYGGLAACNPVTLVAEGRFVGKTAAPGLPSPPATDCQEAAACDQHAGIESAPELEPVEVINLVQIQAQAVEARSNYNPPPWPEECAAPVQPAESVVPAGISIPPAAADPYETMSPCVDDQQDALPTDMPYTDDAEESEEVKGEYWLIDFWKKLFWGTAESEYYLRRYFPPDFRRPGGEEESELVPGGKAPSLREDPGIHQQYPGCPFMERCPGICPRAKPVTPALDVPKPIKKKSEAPSAANTKKIERHLEEDDGEESEFNPLHPDVDTTEFRRSDARPGEFDRRPF